MTDPVVPRIQTIVQLSDDLVAWLDEIASQRQISRSELIREAIRHYLSGSEETRLTQQIVDGYRRVPQGTPDFCGDLDELSAAISVETGRRLDAEERASGLEPW